MVARACRQLAILHRAQLAAERLLGNADPKRVPQPLAEIDNAPADDAMDGRDGPAIDRCRERSPMRVVEPGRLARSLAVEQAGGPFRIEPQHPVSDDLPGDAANLGCLCTASPVVDSRERQ
jgi:hypothetical protein